MILVKPALHSHDREKKMLERSAVTYNMYDGTIKGKFHADGATLGAAFADSRFAVFVLFCLLQRDECAISIMNASFIRTSAPVS